MNNKAVTFLKNFSYTLSSNIISLVVSVIVIIVVPKLIGLQEYGYWQIYLFYSAYVGFLHFGWNDGIYLKYGGREYRSLDKQLLFSQVWMLIIFQIIMATIILCISITLIMDNNRLFIIIMTTICMVIVNVRYMLIYILQATNRIKEYAQITLIERLLYCFLILLLLIVGVRQYHLLIVADILGKLISLVYSAYCCRDIVFRKVSSIYLSFRETFENISIGIKLMFANIAGMLIVGVVRFGIERTWSVSTFGKVSLILSISNFMMVFINAIGVIVFPVLRRTNDDQLSKIYSMIRTLLMILLLALLVIYYPMKMIFEAWLPKYGDSLMYMALVFPMCIYEGQMALLINTYLKTLRKEKIMLSVNLVSVLLSIILTLWFTIIYKNLSLALVSIVLLLAFRCAFAEFFLSRILNISIYKDILLEMLISLIFIITSWFMDSWIGVGYYLISYGLYLLIKRKDISVSIKYLKQLIK